MLSWISSLFKSTSEPTLLVWKPEWSEFLAQTVAFYRALTDVEKEEFERRCLLFLNTTRIEVGASDATEQDYVLVAASAVIPVWSFERWHYFNLEAVFLLPELFNETFECGAPNSRFSGMVGTGHMAGKMALSLPHLRSGFVNDKDKSNVGIHEFVHLIDMMDGMCDGIPERIHKFHSVMTWVDFIQSKMDEITTSKTGIRNYGAYNQQEFFATASEFFFEQPKLLKNKHPKLYNQLSQFYQQNLAEIDLDVQIKRKAPCPCGSGKRYKRCCMPQ